MPILYHPTASYQFYIAPGSTSVSITAAMFGAGGVTLDIETTAASVGITAPIVTPNFALANTAPSNSTHGIDYGDTAVGRLHMLSRLYSPGTTQNFMVAADVVDPAGIDHVEVWCHGSSASSSTISKNAVGVQGYNFDMFFPAGVTSNGTTTVYAKLVPVNGNSRIINKDIRCVVPVVLEKGPEDLDENADISGLIGYSSGGTYEDNRILKLRGGNYTFKQGGLGTTNGFWNEVQAKAGNTSDVVISPYRVDGGITQSREGTYSAGTWSNYNRPELRIEHVVWEGVTLDLKNSQPTITINGEYSGYNNCTITDSWWNEEDGGRTYGIKSHELTQTSFYDYSTNGNRVARHEVHNTHLNSMVAGGACEYMNVTANCSFDPMYLSWSFLQNGSSAGLSVLETGMTINKMESIGGDKALFQTSTSTEDYLVVTGSTLGASGETIINVVSGASAGRTFSWPTNLSTAGGVDPSDRYMQRSDFLCGYWKSGEEHSVVNRKRLYSQYKQTQLWGTSATADKKIVFRDIDYTNELPVGTELFMAIWAHPDGFQVGGATEITGLTMDNILVQDYRIYQDEQPMLFQGGPTLGIDNVVFSNCSFEQYTRPRMGLLAQIKNGPRRMALKYCSFPTTLSFSFRNGASDFIQPIRFIADSSVFKQIGTDVGGVTFTGLVDVRNSAYSAWQLMPGATTHGSTQLSSNYFDNVGDQGAGGNINRYGVGYSSIGKSTTKGLPYSIGGTIRPASREIGAYELNDTPLGYKEAIKLRVFASGDYNGLQLIDYAGLTLSQEYLVDAIDTTRNYEGTGSTTGMPVNWSGTGLTLSASGISASFNPTSDSWSLTAATGGLIDSIIGPGASVADIDVARFAIPSGMVTTASTYIIDYVGENVNPAEYLTTAPTIIHNGVTAHVGTKTFLTYPDKGTTSSFVYRKEIELVPDSMNTFTLRRNATDTQTIKILQRPSLNIVTVANDAEFAAALDGGYTLSGLTLDEIHVNYNCTLNNVWNLQGLAKSTTENTSRRSWITVAPTGGNSVYWSGMEGMTNDVRTNLTYIRYKNCLIGSSSDSYIGGNYYQEKYANLLFDGCTFESRYNDTDYTNIQRPPGIRATILGSSADIASIVAGEYVYQGNGGPTGDSAPTTSTNFGYLGIQIGDVYGTGNSINEWITGTSAGVSFGQFNVYGQKQGTGVSGTYVAGATLNIAYNSNQSLGVTTGNIRGFTLESYTTLVGGDAQSLNDDGTAGAPLKRTRIEQNWDGGSADNQPWRGYVDCNFVNLSTPGHSWCSLMRDCRMSGLRVDIATGALCSINNYATNVKPYRHAADTYGSSYTHVDLHQWWGNPESHDTFQHQNFYYGGHLVENSGGGTGDTQLQTILFDRSAPKNGFATYTDNNYIFIRDSVTRVTSYTTNNWIQFAGYWHHIGLNNISLGGIPQSPSALNVQYDRNENLYDGASFDHFYVNGITTDTVSFAYQVADLDQVHSYVNVINTNDISSYLNGVTTEGYGAGITWSNVYVYPAPEYGIFAADTDNSFYRTDSSGSFVNTFAPRTSQIATGITGANMSKISLQPLTASNRGLQLTFGTTLDKNNFQTANPGVTLEIVSTAGVTYTYGWTGGWEQWNQDTVFVRGSNETTGTTWDNNWTDLYARFGATPKYKIEEN